MQSNITYHSKYGPFPHERTIQFNSDVATSRRPHKHGNVFLLFAWANKGDGLKASIVTYHIVIYSREEAEYPAYIVSRIISAHLLRIYFEMSVASIVFLLELRKSIIYFEGSLIQDNGHSVAREHLLLLTRIYTFYRVPMFRLANRRIISINSTYRARHNWNRNPEEKYFRIKSLSGHEGVLEYLRNPNLLDTT